MEPQDYIQRLGALRSGRGNWDDQWEEAAARVIPAHRDSFTGREGLFAGNSGQKKTEVMYDATAAFAALRFASVMESITTPQGSIWNQLKVLDKIGRAHV